MSCPSFGLCEFVLTPDLDAEDVRLGQLLVLVSGISIVVAERVLELLYFG